MAQGGSGISEVPQHRVIMQGQLCLLTSTAQHCLMPQEETPTADPKLAEFIHRRLLRTAPASLFTLLNTSGWPLQAKQALVDQTRLICIHRAMDLVPLLLDSSRPPPPLHLTSTHLEKEPFGYILIRSDNTTTSHTSARWSAHQTHRDQATLCRWGAAPSVPICGCSA